MRNYLISVVLIVLIGGLTTLIACYDPCSTNPDLEQCQDDSNDNPDGSGEDDTSNDETVDICENSADAGDVPGGQSDLCNPEAVIPPQCYTKTQGHFNPCYTCHQDQPQGQGRANRMFDAQLQGDYSFSDVGVTNHWSNLFIDRSDEVAAISDEAITAYVNEDNYAGLAARLAAQNWQGYMPDLANLAAGAAAFDRDGFALDNSGWVAFNYKPLASTFWPTNGSTDDVMIRLPQAFRSDGQGNPSRTVYLLNLSIVEAAIKNMTRISIPATDETSLGIDLNGDGTLSVVDELLRPAMYLGGAQNIPVETFLYPQGIEFLHSVRYVGVSDNGDIVNATRMKELRYMRKVESFTKVLLGTFYDQEFQEKYEGNLPYYPDVGDYGINNKFGWWISGFIEDANGDLRPQTYEENLFCMGCHTTIGATLDQTFALPRKVDGAAGWGYINLKGMSDVPSYGESRGEILTYLERVGGGSEFRNNDEIAAKYFNNGILDETAVLAEPDVYALITPSPQRARMLNKAYKVIVESQRFIHGRDATVTPPANVFHQVDNDAVPLDATSRHNADIRLSW